MPAPTVVHQTATATADGLHTAAVAAAVAVAVTDARGRAPVRGRRERPMEKGPWDGQRPYSNAKWTGPR